MTSTTDIATGTDWVAGTWTIDPSHSEVGFTVRHLVSKVRGQFETFEGTLTTGETLEETRANASIDLNSVNTRDAGRDGHLRSADFFDVENHGPMTFATTSFDGQTAHRRAHAQGRDPDRRARRRVPRHRRRPVGRHPRGLRGHHGDQPQGLRRELQRHRRRRQGHRVGDKVQIHLAIEAVLDQA